MRIVIPGGTGQVGTVLARAFHADGHEVVVLSRRADGTQPWRVVAWDGETVGDWAGAIDDADVVVNLAGRSVNCRYTPENRREIKESRVRSTRVVGEAIANAARPPRVWLQASTATIYAHRHDAPNDEATGIIGGDEPGAPDTWRFSIDVATSWERAHEESSTPRTRKVLMRSAIMMSPDRGGAFDLLLRFARFGLGGRNGDGRQFVSWVHDRDFVRAVRWLIDHEELDGPVNVASPNPLPNAEFMRAMREAWGMPIGMPATEWMIEVGTFLMRTESELVLKSRRVVPKRLLDSGFTFDFPTWPEAARDLCERWSATPKATPRERRVPEARPSLADDHPDHWDAHWREEIARLRPGRYSADLRPIWFVFLVRSIRELRRRGVRRILFAGNGIDQTPRALAHAGFDVVALDFSGIATRFAESHVLTDAELRLFFQESLDGKQPRGDFSDEYAMPGGSVRWVTGDFLDRSVEPGPFDCIVASRSLQGARARRIAEVVDALDARMSDGGVMHVGLQNAFDVWQDYERAFRARGYGTEWSETGRKILVGGVGTG